MLRVGDLNHALNYYEKVRAVDYQWDGDQFATAGAQVDIWDHSQSPFNSGEPNILSTSSSITLYDRLSTPVRKLIMQTETKAFSWNLMEPIKFTVKSNSLPLAK
ncbi:hypothetical protein C5167_025562 [Papaver somniferum]|uniref:Uncharacterized protein n=1 Tax=Papaver somniferum TaxID=3469 RepID=A0A4Y7JV09_PAPSO|nr:hypothetical protein C5167_025562 [Papaver somniferum]